MQDRAIPVDVRFAILTPKPASRQVHLSNLVHALFLACFPVFIY